MGVEKRGPVHMREESRVCQQNLDSLLGIGLEKKGRLKQVVCYQAGDEAGGLDLEERLESEGGHPAVSLAGDVICFLDVVNSDWDVNVVLIICIYLLTKGI